MNYYNQPQITTLLNLKQNNITGAATSILPSSLSSDFVLVSDAIGKVGVSIIQNTKLGYLSDVTSNIQAHINSNANQTTSYLKPEVNALLHAKQDTISGAATSILSSDLTIKKALISNASGKVAASNVSDVELGYLSGVTSAIQTQISNKQNTITGGASPITSSNSTADFALVSNASGKGGVSTITTAKLRYLTDVTSNIQAQLNLKQATVTGGITTGLSAN